MNLALELDETDAYTAKYIRGTNALYREDANGTKQHYLYNAHGDVVQLTDNGGDVTKTYVYDAFGNELNPDPTDANPLRYAGEYYDAETGTYYLRARYYDAAIGRFIGEDTWTGNANDPLSLNLYIYCGNNPIIYVDSTGNWPTRQEIDQGLIYVAENVRASYPTQVFIGLTISGELDEFLNRSLGATPDEQGVYHIKQDYWQSWKYIGDNDFYDYVFKIATGAVSEKFPFRYNEEEYIIWAWKGNYVNLGGGAELGIYYGGEPHWLIDKALAMEMTMELYLDGQEIASWAPDEKNWWITSFVPEYQNVSAADITAIFTINFPGNTEMYEDFRRTWEAHGSWTFNSDTYEATLIH